LNEEKARREALEQVSVFLKLKGFLKLSEWLEYMILCLRWGF
jgi:hypothetical protein